MTRALACKSLVDFGKLMHRMSVAQPGPTMGLAGIEVALPRAEHYRAQIFVLVLIMIEEIPDAELRHQPGQEIECRLVVLNAIRHLRKRGGAQSAFVELEVGKSIRHLVDNLDYRLVLENPIGRLVGHHLERGNDRPAILPYLELLALHFSRRSQHET